MLTPAKRATPGRPLAVPWKVTNPHVDPAFITPLNVKRPWQSPPSTPVARKDNGTGDGVFVSPGSFVVTPVGEAGVPPPGHVVAACAQPAPASAAGARAAPGGAVGGR